MPKRTATPNLTEPERAVPEELCGKKDLSITVSLRKTLRFYECVEERLEKGDTLLFEDEAPKEKAENMML